MPLCWLTLCQPRVSDSMAQCVWLWDMQKLRLQAVLEHTSAVRCFAWDPRRPRLALCTGNAKLYLWSPAACVSVKVEGEGVGECKLLNLKIRFDNKYVPGGHVDIILTKVL